MTIDGALLKDGLVDGRDVSTDGAKLDTIEIGADITDATNVNAAGATMNTDSTLVGNSYFLDEDTMSSNSATKVASQQSIKAYADTKIADAGTPTDHALIRADGTSGTAVQGSGVICDDSDNLTGINNITIGGELDGARETIGAFGNSRISSNSYLKTASAITCSATHGWIAPYNGSLRSISVSSYIAHTHPLNNGTMKFEVYINGAASGLFKSWNQPPGGLTTRNGTTTAARGTYTFSAGDVINVYASSVETWNSSSKGETWVEAQLDT